MDGTEGILALTLSHICRQAASPILVGDRLIVAAERGAIFVLSSGDEFEMVARNELGEGIYATPAAVDNTLYIRTSDHLWAFGEDQ